MENMIVTVHRTNKNSILYCLLATSLLPELEGFANSQSQPPACNRPVQTKKSLIDVALGLR